MGRAAVKRALRKTLNGLGTFAVTSPKDRPDTLHVTWRDGPSKARIRLITRAFEGDVRIHLSRRYSQTFVDRACTLCGFDASAYRRAENSVEIRRLERFLDTEDVADVLAADAAERLATRWRLERTTLQRRVSELGAQLKAVERYLEAEQDDLSALHELLEQATLLEADRWGVARVAWLKASVTAYAQKLSGDPGAGRWVVFRAARRAVLGPASYDAFCDHSQGLDLSWLAGRGETCSFFDPGTPSEVWDGDDATFRRVCDDTYVDDAVLVTSPGKPTLLVNPEGRTSARYTGLQVTLLADASEARSEQQRLTSGEPADPTEA